MTSVMPLDDITRQEQEEDILRARLRVSRYSRPVHRRRHNLARRRSAAKQRQQQKKQGIQYQDAQQMTPQQKQKQSRKGTWAGYLGF